MFTGTRMGIEMDRWISQALPSGSLWWTGIHNGRPRHIHICRIAERITFAPPPLGYPPDWLFPPWWSTWASHTARDVGLPRCVLGIRFTLSILIQVLVHTAVQCHSRWTTTAFRYRTASWWQMRTRGILLAMRGWSWTIREDVKLMFQTFSAVTSWWPHLNAMARSTVPYPLHVRKPLAV